MLLTSVLLYFSQQGGAMPQNSPEPITIAVESFPWILNGEGEVSIEVSPGVVLVGPTAISRSFFNAPRLSRQNEGQGWLAVPVALSDQKPAPAVKLRGKWRIALMPSESLDTLHRSIVLKALGTLQLQKESPLMGWDRQSQSLIPGYPPSIFVDTNIGKVFWPFEVYAPPMPMGKSKVEIRDGDKED